MTFLCKSKIKKGLVFLSGIMTITYLLLPSSVQADASVKFHGTLIASSCSVESTQVEFGDVSLDKVSSFKSGYANKNILTTTPMQREFSIKMNCTGNVDEIQYKWSGNLTDSLYLATDMTGLVIEIADAETHTIVPPNSWFPPEGIKLTSTERTFLAILLKDSTATFEGGEFNATATFAVQIP